MKLSGGKDKHFSRPTGNFTRFANKILSPYPGVKPEGGVLFGFVHGSNSKDELVVLSDQVKRCCIDWNVDGLC